MRRRLRRGGFKWGTLLPLFALLGLLFVYPLVELVRLAFSVVTAQGTSLHYAAAGLGNFRQAFHDQTFEAAVTNNLAFIVGATLLSTALGVGIALLTFHSKRLRRVAPSILLWPSVIAPVAVSVIWWMLIDAQFGLLNDVLKGLGLPTQGWLGSSHTALFTLMVVDTWHWTPICFLLSFAALQAIDTEVIEAARVDGAGTGLIARHVLLPLIAPTIGAILAIRALMGTKVFDEFYVLTGGGPGTATTVLSLDIRNVFFTQLDFGYGASLGVLVAVGLIVAWLLTQLIRRGPSSLRGLRLWLTRRRRPSPKPLGPALMHAGSSSKRLAGREP